MSTALEKAVCEAVELSFQRAERAIKQRLPRAHIRFDLRGQSAGQARMPRNGEGRTELRFNRVLLQENPDAFVQEVAPHEVAHLAVFWHFGPNVRPHGPEWRWMMETVLGVPATVRHTMAVQKRTRVTYPYLCACPAQVHQLTAIRHNRIQRGQTRYSCKRCGQQLRIQSER